MLGAVTAVLIAAAPVRDCSMPDEPTVAVLNVELARLPVDLVRLLSNALRNAFVDSHCFRVQDEGQMREILETQKFNGGDSCDESCAVQTGRFLQVRYLAVAQVFGDSEHAIVMARITDVETGTSVRSARINVPSTSGDVLATAMEKVAAQLVFSTTEQKPLYSAPSYVALVTAGLGLAGAAVAGGLAWSSYNSAHTAGQSGDAAGYSSASDAFHSRGRIADISLGIGIVAGAAGLWLMKSEPAP